MAEKVYCAAVAKSLGDISGTVRETVSEVLEEGVDTLTVNESAEIGGASIEKSDDKTVISNENGIKLVGDVQIGEDDVGSNSTPVYINEGVITACDGVVDKVNDTDIRGLKTFLSSESQQKSSGIVLKVKDTTFSPTVFMRFQAEYNNGERELARLTANGSAANLLGGFMPMFVFSTYYNSDVRDSLKFGYDIAKGIWYMGYYLDDYTGDKGNKLPDYAFITKGYVNGIGDYNNIFHKSGDETASGVKTLTDTTVHNTTSADCIKVKATVSDGAFTFPKVSFVDDSDNVYGGLTLEKYADGHTELYAVTRNADGTTTSTKLAG